MDKSEMFGFSLETDDRTEEEKARQRALRKPTVGLGQEQPKAPMDTDYQEEMEPHQPQIRFNLNFDKGIRGEAEHQGQRSSRTFDRDQLFEAVASGDVGQLEGLEQYLLRSMKKLSDTLYQSYGKTALMKALLHLKDGQNETVERLIDISEKTDDVRKFVNVAYSSPYYRGQTALHIAIERRSLSYVKLLVSKGADVHARACGTFFQPHDGPNFYFGELPLSLAACTNQPSLVDFLMDNPHQPADASQTDSHGNTVLHALVIVADNSPENTKFIAGMYDRILVTAARLTPELRLENIANQKGMTPFKMAAQMGKIQLFSHILKREFHDCSTKHISRKFTEWVYGPVTCSLYDLAALDSYEDNSVLEILVYGSGIPRRHEMLLMEPLNGLLESKWKKFAGPMFLFNFLAYLVYLCVFTVIAYNKKSIETPFDHSMQGYLYLAGQILTLLANCYFFLMGIVDMKKKRPKLQSLLVDGYYEILFLFQAMLFLAAAAFYLVGRDEYLAFLVLCLALSWVNVLYFSRGQVHMGIYSVMIQKMILSDILRFLFVYVVFLFGFSAAVVTLLIEPPPESPPKSRLFTQSSGTDCFKPSYRNISYTTMQLFKFTIGMGDMEFTEDYQYKEVFYVLLICYIILTYILLLNMLIALMNRTVEQTTKESTSIWGLQRAITILDMERRMPCGLKRALRCGVKKKLATAVGEDQRWCFRVEEVNWNKWNIHLGKINEEPGCGDRPAADTSPSRRSRRPGKSLRGFIKSAGRRQTYDSAETDHLRTSVV